MMRSLMLAAGLILPSLAVAAAEPLKVGDPAPEFALLNTDSMTVRLAQYRDRQPVVLVFSRAAWCPYCLGHMKALQGKYADFKKAGAEVIAVFREDSARIDGLKKVREATKAEFVLLTDYEAQKTKPYSPEGYAAYVIDRMGIIRAIIPGTKAGRPDVDKLLDAVKLLAAK
jgi:peroxiredoxin